MEEVKMSLIPAVSPRSRENRRKGTAYQHAFTLVEIMIVVLIIGILLAIAVPNFIRAREQSRAKSCSANLKQIDSAKQQWAMDNKIANTNATVPTLDATAATGLVGPSLY